MAAYLEQLCDVHVDRIPLLDKLKQTARTGKAVRFDRYSIQLPKRSVYDHIISLPDQADFFLSLCRINVDLEQLNSLLLFHDLSEALIGDVPSFTPKSLAKETYMTAETKALAERKANERLLNVLPNELKGPFERFLNLDPASLLYRFFHMVDKTDPIIAIWRYLHLYRDQINIDQFLEAMTDFFINPETQSSCIDKKALTVVQILQNKGCARNFFLNPDRFWSHFDKEICQPLKQLIEDREMHVISLSNESV